MAGATTWNGRSADAPLRPLARLGIAARGLDSASRLPTPGASPKTHEILTRTGGIDARPAIVDRAMPSFAPRGTVVDREEHDAAPTPWAVGGDVDAAPPDVTPSAFAPSSIAGSTAAQSSRAPWSIAQSSTAQSSIAQYPTAQSSIAIGRSPYTLAPTGRSSSSPGATPAPDGHIASAWPSRVQRSADTGRPVAPSKRDGRFPARGERAVLAPRRDRIALHDDLARTSELMPMLARDGVERHPAETASEPLFVHRATAFDTGWPDDQDRPVHRNAAPAASHAQMPETVARPAHPPKSGGTTGASADLDMLVERACERVFETLAIEQQRRGVTTWL